MKPAHDWNEDIRQMAMAMSMAIFWSYVDTPDANGCRTWNGYAENGYGRFFFQDEMVGAHELSVFFATGEIRPEGWETCHSCHNPICVESSHLRYDTRQGNVDDAVAAGRHARGSQTQSSRITEKEVLEIRHRVSFGAGIVQLANEYGISAGSVSMIASGKRWQHVAGPITTRPTGRPKRSKNNRV